MELGRYSLLYRDCDDAVMYLRRLVTVNPGCAEAYNQLAYAYQYLNDFDNAIWAINQYITLAPMTPIPMTPAAICSPSAATSTRPSNRIAGHWISNPIFACRGSNWAICTSTSGISTQPRNAIAG